MEKSLSFLMEAADFQIIGEETEKPSLVESFGIQWERKFTWINKGYGIGYTWYQPVNGATPIFPNPEIWVDSIDSSMPQWQDHMEVVYFGGVELFRVSDNWGRRGYSLWPSGMDWTGISPENAQKEWERKNASSYYEKTMERLAEKGYSKDQAKKFMRSKASWKWEIADRVLYILSQEHLSKDLFKELSESSSHRQYDYICQKWQIDMFNETSLPRKTAYCKLIADMK